MDDRSSCWRCGEPRQGDEVCALCGAVPARARAKVRSTAGGTAMVDPAPPPPPVDLSPPRPEDRVAGPAAPPVPPAPPSYPLPPPLLPLLPPTQPVRHLWWLKIALAVGVSVVGFGIRVALRDATGPGDGRVRQADTPTVFEGKCVNVEGGRVRTVSCGDAHIGRVLAVVDETQSCPDETFDALFVRSDPTRRLCIGPS